MRINPISNNQSNNTNFKAVNQKYYKWAEREVNGVGRLGELLEQLRYEVAWGDIHPQDGIDTVNAIIELRGGTNEWIEHVLDCFRRLLAKSK